jgi:hypothetical protein
VSDSEEKSSSETGKTPESAPPPKPAPSPRPATEPTGTSVSIVVIMQSVGLIIFCALVLVLLVMCHHRH